VILNIIIICCGPIGCSHSSVRIIHTIHNTSTISRVFKLFVFQRLSSTTARLAVLFMPWYLVFLLHLAHESICLHCFTKRHGLLAPFAVFARPCFDYHCWLFSPLQHCTLAFSYRQPWHILVDHRYKNFSHRSLVQIFACSNCTESTKC
jgi:hypothetical protein